MRFIKKSMIVVGMMTSVAASAGTVSDITTASTDVIFSAPTSITNTLTAVTGLNAGVVSADTVLANGSVALIDSSSMAVFAVTASAVNPFTGSGFEASGTNDANNKLLFAIGDNNGQQGDIISENIDGVNWFILNNNAESNQAGYTINTTQEQTVAADSYKISIDAAVYNA